MDTRDKNDIFSAELELTNNAMEKLFDVVDGLDFSDGNEAEAVYRSLKKEVMDISFSDYLKRYIYRKMELQGSWREIADDDYAMLILNSFDENSTPFSFEPTKTKRTAIVRNWLRQYSVGRKVVLILGFGLGMDVDDVDDFLTHGLKETRLNPKDPFEVICWYCYKYKQGYPAFERLYNKVLNGIPDDDVIPELDDATIQVRRIMYSIENERDLLNYIKLLLIVSDELKTGITAAREFDSLYDRVMSLSGGAAGADIETLLYEIVPRDDNGNLVSVKQSKLTEVFEGKRLTRQRISQIKSGKAKVSRYDLITLNFIVYGYMTDILPQRRYIEFINSTNAILEKCGMSSIYYANPYESFLMMCMLSGAPVDTCAEVWGLSYEEEG